MIFPSIKVIRKAKQEVTSELIPYQRFKYNLQPDYVTKASNNLTTGRNGIRSNTRSYKPYSKTKAHVPVIRNIKKSGTYLYPKNTPELIITPQYISMIKDFSDKVSQDLVTSQNLTSREGKVNRTYKVLRVTLNPTINPNRRVVLSKTPDPWCRFQNQFKPEPQDSSSDSSSNYNY